MKDPVDNKDNSLRSTKYTLPDRPLMTIIALLSASPAGSSALLVKESAGSYTS